MSPELGRFISEIPSAVALFDRDLCYVAASAAWLDAFALTRAETAGHRHDQLCETAADALLQVQRRALSGEAAEHHLAPPDDRMAIPRLTANPHRDGEGEIVGVIVALRQIGPRAAVTSLGGRDPVTGLVKRDGFLRRLRELLAEAEPERREAIVFAIHLDNFRNLINLHGAATGDEILKVTAERLLAGTRSRYADEDDAAARGTDVVARLGIDEFGVICGPPAITVAEAEGVGSRLLRIMQSPISLNGEALRLRASIGLMRTGEMHADQNDAMRDLDFALQQAQAVGPGKIVAWEPALTQHATHRHSLAEQLYRAFDNGEFVVHYQPVLRLSDERLVGAEALLRWNHPSDGLLSSASFIPVLEDTGLIVEVGCWVIREVVRQIESWHLLYGRHFVEWISVNLSPRQLHNPAPLLATLHSIYDGGFSVHRLRLETTETALLQKPETTQAVLADLDRLGIRVAIDDFGNGYSSLQRLRQSGVDTLKIDAEFIARIGDAEGEKMAQALLDLGHNQGADLIAEGIETTAQRDFLRASGCGLGQGFLFAAPMDGVLLGAYALTHGANAEGAPVRDRLVG